MEVVPIPVPIAAVPLNIVPPPRRHSWSPYEQEIFIGIVEKNNGCYNEKEFLRHPDAEKLAHRSFKSIRKFRKLRMTQLNVEEAEVFKKKWTAAELKTLQEAIDKHGFKIKLIIKDRTYDAGLGEKSIKQIGRRLRKLALEVLQNRNGGKKSGVNTAPADGNIEDIKESIKAVLSSKPFVEKVSTQMSLGFTSFVRNGLTSLFRDEGFLKEVCGLVHEDFLNKCKPSNAA